MDPVLAKVHGIDGVARVAAMREWLGSNPDPAEKDFRTVVTLQGSTKSSLSDFFGGLLAETISTKGSSAFLLASFIYFVTQSLIYHCRFKIRC